MKKFLITLLIIFGVLSKIFIVGFIIYGVVDIARDIKESENAEDEIVISIGQYISKEYDDHTHSPRDMLSYVKYGYDVVDLNDNEYFRKITDDTYNEFKLFVKDFGDTANESCSCDKESLLNNYNFDMEIVSENDYLYMEYEQYFSFNEYGYTYYHLYFLDMETKVLHEFYKNM